MNRKRLRASHEDSDGNLWTIIWEGGAYADLVHPYKGPVEVLNFWDYHEDAPQKNAPKNAKELERLLEKWLDESADWLHNY
jgi:hypothetical protein